MSYWIYSTESFPNEQLQGKPGYTPEWLAHAGVQLPQIMAKTWTEIPSRFSIVRHRDWRDRSGTKEVIPTDDIVPALRARFGDRGVVIMDHEPNVVERRVEEKKSAETNLAFRMSAVEWYENQVREKEVTGTGRTRPTPYEDQCYTILGLTKPYSVEAMRAQRHPGEAVGEQIVAALERLERRREEEKTRLNPPQKSDLVPAGAAQQ